MDNQHNTINTILERNARVEMEKAWEVSWTRRLSLGLLTYVVVWFFLWQLGIALPFLQALVPAGAFILSTLSLPWIRKLWMERKAPNPKHQ